MPNIALLPELKKDFAQIYYIGTNGIEKELIKNVHDVEFKEISAAKLERDKFYKIFALPFKLHKSINEAKRILKQIKPAVIFSKGGYVSVPAVIAAHKLKIPIVSHESDLSMGLANKIIKHYCDIMCTSFEETAKNQKKCVFTGTPIRRELLSGTKQKGKAMCKIDESKPTVLFIGGSSGAVAINNILYKVLPSLTKRYNIVHIAGRNKGNSSIICPNYTQFEYVKDIEDIYALTDFVVSRAGSNAINEFLFLKKPMLLIPLPKGASRGDQLENARLFKNKGYAEVLEQQNLNEITLLEALTDLEKNKQHLINNMKAAKNANACKKIAEVIQGALNNN